MEAFWLVGVCFSCILFDDRHKGRVLFLVKDEDTDIFCDGLFCKSL